jgi:hypothetical protein
MRLIASGILVVCTGIWTISTSGAVEEAKCSNVDEFPRSSAGAGELPNTDCHPENDGGLICNYDAKGCSWAVGPDERWPDASATEHLPEGWVSCKKPKVEQILHFRDGSRRFFSDACIVEGRRPFPDEASRLQPRDSVPATIIYLEKALKEHLDKDIKDLRISLNDEIRTQVKKQIAELVPPPRPQPPTDGGSTVTPRPQHHYYHHYYYHHYYYHHYYYYPWCPPPWWDDPWW